MKKDHPILFNGEMVRAILNGRKTQTRRVIKPQPIWVDGKFRWHQSKTTFRHGPNEEWLRLALRQHCPCGVPSDLLWVRETWRVDSVGYCCQEHKAQHNIHIEFAEGGDIDICGNKDMRSVAYRYYDRHEGGTYSPSIHMPKWTCRLWLRVKSVRVERVQEISETDCIHEGITLKTSVGTGLPDHGSAYSQFRDLWDSINKNRGFGWDVNPWVWVVDFERYDK